MKQSIGHSLAALSAGILFGAGLILSGMTQPQKVIGFLDLFGQFDASLMFVMIGAIAVHALAYRALKARPTPLYSRHFVVPTRRDIDVKLLLGAFVFGAGWGLGGYCPGPGIVSLAAGGASALAFVAAMIAGMFATTKVEAYAAKRRSHDPAAARATHVSLPTQTTPTTQA